MDDIRIVAGQPSAADRGALVDALLEYNRQVTGILDDDEFSVFLHDDDGVLIGGLYGWVYGGAAEIALLWVREDRRGTGLGSRLLEGAEDHARRAGSAQMVIRTHSFQAPAFYRAHGYQEVARIPDYPRGHAYHLLRKAL
jgi:ribosomal protein S18 acetylase RimI-like enzyme